MKKRSALAIMLVIFLASANQVQASEGVVRNQVFTTSEEMKQKMHSEDEEAWMSVYLTKIEGYYWNFSRTDRREDRNISLDLVSSAYQNLEMFLDDGYLLSYDDLKAYCEDYRERAGKEDAFYRILTDCLNNPYLLNRPDAVVTATTYNGRDYAEVFDADYYYNNNPDLQVAIGYHPEELLRHFVENGINEGRKGNVDFDIDAYIQQIDQDVLGQVIQSNPLQASGAVGRYSYSRANYYGKYLGHYNYESMFTKADQEDSVGY